MESNSHPTKTPIQIQLWAGIQMEASGNVWQILSQTNIF